MRFTGAIATTTNCAVFAQLMNSGDGRSADEVLAGLGLMALRRGRASG